jgi:membrane-bound serine protease (ClpP class)
MRKEMKATAEAKHRRGDIAEAMVDASVVIEGLDGKDTTLTLTTTEALKYKYAAFSVESLDEICKKLGCAPPAETRPEMNWAERIARVLSDPAISSLLMSLGMLGLLIELWAPGHAVAGTLGVICLLLFFFGHHVVHLAGWETIVLFALGAAAVGFEVLFWPGHGALAILGAIAIVVSLVMALLNVHSVPLDVSLSLGWVTRALARVSGSLLLTLAAMVVVSRFLPNTRFGKRLILQEAITANAGAAASQVGEGAVEELLGSDGVAETTLRPAGKVRIRGQRYDVVTEGEYVDAGTAIVVSAVDGSRIVVRKA